MKISNNIKVLEKADKDFPWFLANMEDTPEKLYCIGDTSLLTLPAIAVVGARKCSDYGRQAALKIGEMLAANDIVTVSGLARGIDGFAHSGALGVGGKTIAVLGCGPDICYPRYNRKLYEDICHKGLIVSEYPPATEPLPWRFPQRNRIISALSEAVVVVEAGLKSGSLITAVTAAAQGKEVLALPGNINSPYSVGTNKLIQDGAAIITNLQDILQVISASLPPYATQSTFSTMMDIIPTATGSDTQATVLNLGTDELLIYNQLEQFGSTTCDQLCGALGKTPAFINGILTALEIKGVVSYSNGKISIAKF